MDSSIFICIDGQNYCLEIEYLKQRRMKKASPRLHIQPSYHIILISDGANKVFFKEHEPILVKKNSLLFINPMVPHSFCPDKADGVEHTSIIWKLRDQNGNCLLVPLQRLLGCNEEQCQNFMIKPLTDIDASFFIQRVREAEYIYHRKNSIPVSFCLWQLCFLGINLIWPETFKEPNNQLSTYEKIALEVKKIIETELGNSSFDIADIAHELDRHPNYINMAFKSSTGITLGKFIINKRMEMAKSILANSDISVGEVSELCGFSQHSYFSRAFRKYCSMNPLEYRTQMSTGTLR